MSSAAPPVEIGARAEGVARTGGHQRARVQSRPWIRLAGFTALALYGVQRWSRLLAAPPSLRLLGLAALAIALAAGVPLLRRALTPLPTPAARTIAGVVAFGLVLAAFPVAGLRWHLVWHLKIAVAAQEIGSGLGGLGTILVPYDGFDHRVTLVIMLGAAVLLLDAAAVLAFAPRFISDARRATAAMPLIALAVVPSALVHPKDAYLQGLLLFVLLGFFIWGERLRLDGGGAAVALLAVAGVAGLLVAPLIDHGKPWFDYQKWTGSANSEHLASFSWNQTYGPLHWPQNGSQVLSIRADAGQYWKTENLDDFNGTAWVEGPPVALPLTGGSLDGDLVATSLPPPAPSAVRKYSETIRVTIQGMRTTDLIGAGQSTILTRIPGGQHRLDGTGTIEANRELGPGVTYDAKVYAPSPGDPQLTAATKRDYPWESLRGYLTVSIPGSGGIGGVPSAVQFPRFHAPAASAQGSSFDGAQTTAFVSHSPYAPAYALARRLAATSSTELGFVHKVLHYLSTARGFRYNQSPPPEQYPLEAFLFQTKLGYCQQFSGAMALLLRMGGVPTRVATGFTAGQLDNETHTWEVADTDAHAWDEVWFPTYGWVKFDPTPASAPARGGVRAPIASGKAVPNLERKNAGTPRGLSGKSGAGAGAGHGHHHAAAGPSGWALAGIAVGALALCLLVWLGWSVTRPASSTEQLIAELERALARTGRPLTSGVTLAGLEDRYRFTPEVAAYMRALRMSRYGGRAASPDRAQRRALRHELGLGLGPLGRLRALRALPPRLRGTHGSSA